MNLIYNGMPAAELAGAEWQKSQLSSSQGNCMEFAPLPEQPSRGAQLEIPERAGPDLHPGRGRSADPGCEGRRVRQPRRLSVVARHCCRGSRGGRSGAERGEGEDPGHQVGPGPSPASGALDRDLGSRLCRYRGLRPTAA